MYYGCYCGAGFEMALKQKMLFVGGVEQFCSAACLVKFIKETGDSSRLKEIIEKTRENFSLETNYFPIYEEGGWFRSTYEVIVYKFFDQHSIAWVYESRRVVFPDRVSYYISDFLLPEHGYLVEVKGRWTSRGKRKFIDAAKQLPMILIQDYLVKDIKRHAIHTG